MTTSVGLVPATAVTAGGPGVGTETVADVTGGTRIGFHRRMEFLAMLSKSEVKTKSSMLLKILKLFFCLTNFFPFLSRIFNKIITVPRYLFNFMLV